MSAIWCVSEIIADEEDPCIQHIEMTAYIDSNEAERHLGAYELRSLGESKHGVIAGKARITRYCQSLDSLTLSDNAETTRIAGVASKVATGKEMGLIITRSISVPRQFRNQGICRRMLQELRRLHVGMPFIYGHSAVPQEGASLLADFAQRIENLKQAYLQADVGLIVPDEHNNPEIMIAHWNGTEGSIRECTLDWNRVHQNTMAIAA